MASASFDGSGVKAVPIAGPSQSWESYEEDLQCWKLSSELKEEQLGPHIKSRGFSANQKFKDQAKLMDMARLSGKSSAQTATTGLMGFDYLIDFMQKENRSKDDLAKIVRFITWMRFTRGNRKCDDYVTESLRLINEFEQDKFVRLEEFVKALILIANAELSQQQLSNLSTKLDLDATMTVEKTKQAIHKVLGDSVLATRHEPASNYYGATEWQEWDTWNEGPWEEIGDGYWEEFDAYYGQNAQSGCFICGGNHYARNCPSAGSKGKGSKSFPKGSWKGKSDKGKGKGDHKGKGKMSKGIPKGKGKGKGKTKQSFFADYDSWWGTQDWSENNAADWAWTGENDEGESAANSASATTIAWSFLSSHEPAQISVQADCLGFTFDEGPVASSLAGGVESGPPCCGLPAGGMAHYHLAEARAISDSNNVLEQCYHADILDTEAIIDCGCSKAMVSEKRKNRYETKLRELYPNLGIKLEPSHTKYRFAGGSTDYSKALATVPVPSINADSKWEVLDTGPKEEKATPFLMSKPQLENLEARLDFASDTLELRKIGVTKKLRESKAGHYLFPLLDEEALVTRTDQSDVPQQSQSKKSSPTTAVVVSDHPAAYKIEMPPKKEDLQKQLESEKGLHKLHCALGHPSIEHMTRYVAPVVKPENRSKTVKLIELVTEKCKTCCKHKKPLPHPKVGGLMARHVNDIVAIDMLEVKFEEMKYHMHHACDLLSKFSSAEMVKDKTPRGTLKTFARWQSIFGRLPNNVVTDHGTEYLNQEVTEFLQRHGSRHLLTPVETPASNGLIERHNQVLKMIIQKLLHDFRDWMHSGVLTVEDVMLQAVAAKNSIIRRSGFSSQYLATGNNTFFDSIEEAYPPEIDHSSRVEQAAARFELRRQAQQRAIEIMRSKEISKLFNERLLGTGGPLEQGTTVDYHPRDLQSGGLSGRSWIGPCSVIGMQGNKMVWLTLPNGKCECVHRHRVAPRSENGIVRVTVRDASSPVDGTPEPIHTEDNDPDSDYEPPAPEASQRSSSQTAVAKASPKTLAKSTAHPAFPAPTSVPVLPAPSQVTMGSPSVPTVASSIPSTAAPSGGLLQFLSASRTSQGSGATAVAKAPLAPNTAVDVQMQSPAKVAGAAPGKYRAVTELAVTELAADELELVDCFAGISQGTEESVFYASVSEAALYGTLDNYCFLQADGIAFIATSAAEALATAKEIKKAQEVPKEIAEKDPRFEEARARELENLANRHIHVTKKIPAGVVPISCRWVYTIRDGVYKARLVARGYEDPEAGEYAVESPTLHRHSIKFLAWLAAAMGWKLETWDVRGAFTQADARWCDPHHDHNREIWVKPPANCGLEPGTAWLMTKGECLYGFKKAPRIFWMWYSALLLWVGFTQSIWDCCVFYLISSSKSLKGLLGVHVDDNLVGGESAFWCLKEKLEKHVEFGSKTADFFVFCGLRFTVAMPYITVDQVEYCRNLEYIRISTERRKQLTNEVTEFERGDLRKSNGSRIWATDQTAPHEAFSSSFLSAQVTTATVQTLIQANKATRSLRSHDVYLSFGPVNIHNLAVYTFGDSSKGKDPHRGLATFIGEKSGPGTVPEASIYRWTSKRHRRVIVSTMSGESNACESALDVNQATRMRIAEALNIEPPAGILLSDSWSLVSNVYSLSPSVSEEMLIPTLQRLRQACTDPSEELPTSLWYIPDPANVADPLTKASSNPQKILQPIAEGKIDLRQAYRGEIGINEQCAGVTGHEKSKETGDSWQTWTDEEWKQWKEQKAWEQKAWKNKWVGSDLPAEVRHGLITPSGHKMNEPVATDRVLPCGLRKVYHAATDQMAQSVREDEKSADFMKGQRFSFKDRWGETVYGSDIQLARSQHFNARKDCVSEKKDLLKESMKNDKSNRMQICRGSPPLRNSKEDSCAWTSRPAEILRCRADKAQAGAWVAAKKSRDRKKANEYWTAKKEFANTLKECRKNKRKLLLYSEAHPGDADWDSDSAPCSAAEVSSHESDNEHDIPDVDPSVRGFISRNMKRAPPNEHQKQRKSTRRKEAKKRKKEAERKALQALECSD